MIGRGTTPARVVVTGLGAVTPLGVGVRHTWARLIEGKSGIVSVRDRGPQFAAQPCQIAGVVPAGSKATGGWDPKEWLAPGDERKMALFTQYAMAAAQEALDDADWHSGKHPQKTGVYIGSGIGNLQELYDTALTYEQDGYKKVSPLFVPRLLTNMAAAHISIKHDFRGPNHATTSACTTGAHAIGDAARMIRHGDAQVMVAGSAEACIHPLAIAGFDRARSLARDWNDAPHLASRPFDKDRAGFVMSEGAGVVVLESLPHALSRGARIYAELTGYGLASEAHHMTAPQEWGYGTFTAMKHALYGSGLSPAQSVYVNAHATSTQLGDAAEGHALKFLIHKHGLLPKDTSVSSTKGALGHLLGAAGSVEAILSIMALHTSTLPPTLNLDNPEVPSEDLGEVNWVQRKAQYKFLEAVLTNSFGFGGTAASLCFSRFDPASIKARTERERIRRAPAHYRLEIPDQPVGESGEEGASGNADIRRAQSEKGKSKLGIYRPKIPYERVGKSEGERASRNADIKRAQSEQERRQLGHYRLKIPHEPVGQSKGERASRNAGIKRRAARDTGMISSDVLGLYEPPRE